MELALPPRAATPKLRRLGKDQASVGSDDKVRRCSQVSCMFIVLLFLNIWCTFLFVHSFHLCISSGKIDLYCISMSTRARAADQPVELLSGSTIIDRLTDVRAHALAEPSQVQGRKQEPVELKVAAAPLHEGKAVEHQRRDKVDGLTSAKSQMDVLRSWASKTAHATSTPSESCDGRGIFVYQLPTKFNTDIFAHCSDLLPWTNLCEFFANDAMGEKVPELGKRWHRSHQYFLEPIFHSRISNHPCRVYDQNAARLFYVPFYAGLDVLRWHFTNVSAEVKDALGAELVRWLAAQPSWRRNSGADHMFVLGKISWDFRRANDDDHGAWGSNFLLLDEMRGPYKFLIERHPWELSEVGVPHPTHFHPHDDDDITSWQLRLSSAQRKNLASFAGATRDLAAGSIRSVLIEQCTSSGGDCRFLDCSGGSCMRPEAVVGLFMESEFCLQPPGDSATRKSVFDSLVSGCIPVLFNPFTAYYQYPWHLPEDHRKYSVFIEEEEVKEGKANVMERLRKIPAEEREEMRRYIVHQIMPGLVYGDSTARFVRFRDAFDIVVDNMIEKVIRSSG